MILNQTQNKEASWEFLKWWGSTDIQVQFGREMEGIMGAAARYPTANVAALERLPWPSRDIAILNRQWEEVKGIPEVPGSYITGRHLDNALRRVVNTGANSRETLYEFAELINNEMTNKRREFGLD
jgi:ABC-type glycerol-3-phosphate transport system substrate-binding protein